MVLATGFFSQPGRHVLKDRPSWWNRWLLARRVALELRIPLREGVYVAVTGPNLETPAEYRMLRLLGADIVGMSTVPEVIAAVHQGMRVLGVSNITDQCLPDALAPASVERILAVAREAEPRLTALVERVVAALPRHEVAEWSMEPKNTSS